ncbi:MAG: 3-dehydroquinate synthase [Rikenellaceae bacterium]
MEINISKDGSEGSKIVIGETKILLKKLLEGRDAIFITDTNVYPLYKDIIGNNRYITIGIGEENKTLDSVTKIFEELLTIGADRSSFLVGMGGGIVTDITGFVASTYMRGCDFGFIATTLLSQVDASVGGKNGVNFERYKNMVGTFNQPKFVICDINMLSTLPEREIKCGMAEIVKMGLIGDSSLFHKMEDKGYDGIMGDKEFLKEIIYRAIEMKAEIVSRDEREHGDRKKLNLGHTTAHAIEKSSTSFQHGEAVAIGLSKAASISEKLGKITTQQRIEIENTIKKLGLPIDSYIDKETLFQALKSDKKKELDTINFIVMNGIGDCEIVKLKFDDLYTIF